MIYGNTQGLSALSEKEAKGKYKINEYISI